MSKLKCIIVDDEPEAREGVQHLLEKDKEVEVLARCANGLEALEVLQDQKADLLLLDIQMPRINGFEVLNSLPPEYRPEVIFITAYDEYTLKAFEVHAIDYLLKPFTDERFFKALDFAKARIRQQQLQEKQQRLNDLLQNQQRQAAEGREGSLLSSGSGKPTGRLAVKTEGRVHLLPYHQIMWIEAYDYYIKVHTKARYFLLRDSMKNMEKNLPGDQFVRIHKSSIVNLSHVQQINTGGMSELELQLNTGLVLKVSRNYKDRIKRLLNNDE
ncbi:two-component system LytT family response regulator [Catalinimonas alkaloidigena]|uniref:LytR/AlgR family response regulator transcription factor n=1 Tax=Catalinimonas alkaloidigena TaxID=1075417 RepID=UPI0024053846|nr:LytTR family DNA-binding domain-containing protein [Catalinimonas alkaloidigena]MDF9798710.1 two-component system LytT family response regulator [Catalinimonas alkaloidigena]